MRFHHHIQKLILLAALILSLQMHANEAVVQPSVLEEGFFNPQGIEQQSTLCYLANPPLFPIGLGNFYCTKPRRNIYGFVEWLLWEAKEENLDYIQFTYFGPEPPTAPSNLPSTIDQIAHYASGWRVGVGSDSQGGGELYWTHFYSQQTTSRGGPLSAGQFLIPVNFLSDLGNPSMFGADALWRVQFDAVDLEWAHHFTLPRFSLRPHLGVRAAALNQKIEVIYQGVDLNINPERADFLSLNKNDFWGVGMRAGADCAWYFFNRFSLFCKNGLSLLYGHFYVDRHQILQTPLTIGPTTFPPGTERAFSKTLRHQLATAIDLAGGVGYQLPFANFDLNLSLSWEVQVWFSQNQMNQSISPSTVRHPNIRGDLSFQGLTARAEALF